MRLPQPLRLAISLARLLYQNSYMIRAMVLRDIQSRYVGSFLGFFWSVIHPLTQLLIYYFVFAVVMKMRLGAEYGGASYAVWLIVGLLPWMLFAEAVSRSPSAVLDQANLVKKVVFPSEIFPIVNLMAAVLNHAIGLTILLCFLAFSGHSLSLNVLLVIPYLILTGVLVLGISWLLSSVNVFVRDIGQIVGVAVNIWLFLTPVVYPSRLIPESVRDIFQLNPMLHVVEGYRSALLGGSGSSAFSMEGMLYVLTVAIVLFAVGGVTFKRLKPAFPDAL